MTDLNQQWVSHEEALSHAIDVPSEQIYLFTPTEHEERTEPPQVIARRLCLAEDRETALRAQSK